VDPLLQVSDRAGKEMHRKRSAFLPHDPALFGGPRPLHALKGHRDPEKVPEADVEAVRDWLVLVNFHGYCSANPSGRIQNDIETVKDSSGPFPFDDLLSNIKDTRGGATSITSSHILRDIDADLLRRPGQPYLFVLYTALCLSGASDWEGALIRELGPNPSQGIAYSLGAS